MDRFWLLTSTTYGTWLPGDERGSVTRIRNGADSRVELDHPQTPYIKSAPGLSQSATNNLKGPPIFFNARQAQAVAAQFRETANHRNWSILACAVLSNHFHLVVGVPSDPEPFHLLRDFKAYASRRLNRDWQRPASETWWTEKGSMRKKVNWPALRNAVEYVRNQANPHVVWVDDSLVELARKILETQQ